MCGFVLRSEVFIPAGTRAHCYTYGGDEDRAVSSIYELSTNGSAAAGAAAKVGRRAQAELRADQKVGLSSHEAREIELAEGVKLGDFRASDRSDDLLDRNGREAPP